jgi:hypothetical protein
VAAWRTSFQIHRGCSDIRVDGLTLRQNDIEAHSALTIHGFGPDYVNRVSFKRVEIESYVDTGLTERGGVQFVDDGANGVRFDGLRIRTNNWGFSTRPNMSDLRVTNYDIESNLDGTPRRAVNIKGTNITFNSGRIRGDYYGFYVETTGSNVRINNLDAATTNAPLYCAGTDVRLDGFDLTRTAGASTDGAKAVIFEGGADAVRMSRGVATFAGTAGRVISTDLCGELAFSDILVKSSAPGNAFVISRTRTFEVTRIKTKLTTGARAINIENIDSTKPCTGGVEGCELDAGSGTALRMTGYLDRVLLASNRVTTTGIGITTDASTSNFLITGNDTRSSGTPFSISGTGHTRVNNLPAP